MSPGPERRLVAADALADLDDHVARVVGIGRDERDLQLLLDLREASLETRQHLGELGVVARGREVGAQLAPFLRELPGALELLQPPAGLASGHAVGEDGRVGHPLLRVRMRALELVDQSFDVRHEARIAPGLREPSAAAGLRHYFDLALLGGHPTLEAQDLTERADRDLDLVEARLAGRQALEPETRRQERAKKDVLRVLAGEADHLVGEARDERAGAGCA